MTGELTQGSSVYWCACRCRRGPPLCSRGRAPSAFAKKFKCAAAARDGCAPPQERDCPNSLASSYSVSSPQARGRGGHGSLRNKSWPACAINTSSDTPASCSSARHAACGRPRPLERRPGAAGRAMHVPHITADAWQQALRVALATTLCLGLGMGAYRYLIDSGHPDDALVANVLAGLEVRARIDCWGCTPKTCRAGRTAGVRAVAPHQNSPLHPPPPRPPLPPCSGPP